MDDHTDPDDVVLPLRDRLPDYLTVFSIWFGIAAGVGLVIGLLRGSSLWTAIGYTVMLLGVVMMLAGGASGGGYTHLGAGAIGAAFSGRHSDETDEEREDPMDRLRKGLRPEANPRAFWQVIAGILYIAIGIGIVTLGG